MTTRRDLPARRIGSKQVRRQPVRRASPRLRSVQIYGLAFMVLSLIGTVAVCISPAFAAHRLEIYGARFTGEQYIRDLVDLSAGPNLFALQSDRIANQLVLLPAVESVKVEVVLPDTIVVTVQERKPSLIWVIGDSRYVVDDTGLLFGVVDSVGNPVMDAAVPAAGSDARSRRDAGPQVVNLPVVFDRRARTPA
jgi:cell division protein FtsQ